MKYIGKWYMACLAIAFGCLAVACSEDEEMPVEATFTAPAEFDLTGLETCGSVVDSFKVTSNGVWQVYSNRTWVKLSFEKGGYYFNDVQGVEGTYTVYMKITADELDFNESEATVTLLAGGKKQTVATIRREGKAYVFTLLSGDGEEVDRIEIGKDATAWVAPSANFECSILSWPAWLGEPEALSGGYTLNVLKDAVPFIKKGAVTFGNIDSTVVFCVPVEYSGMDPMEIVIDGEYTPWGWKVELDGKTFLQKTISASGENITTVVENALAYSVTCLNYDYRLFAAQEKDGKLSLMDEGDSWIVASQDEADISRLSVSVSPSSLESRTGYLFAVPAASYGNFMDSLSVSSDVDSFVDSHINYVVVELEQKSLESTDGFVITDNNGAAVDCFVDDKYYEWLCSEYGIEDVTTCNLVPGKSYTLVTRLKADEWQGAYALQYIDDRSYVELSDWGITATNNPVLGEDGLYRFNIEVPTPFDREVILRLFDATSGQVNKKALVIRPATK